MSEKDVRNPHFGLYVIYDVVAEEAGVPMMFRTDGLAVRAYNSAKLEFKQDHFLYKIAEYDPVSMSVYSLGVPKRISVSIQEDVEV